MIQIIPCVPESKLLTEHSCITLVALSKLQLNNLQLIISLKLRAFTQK